MNNLTNYFNPFRNLNNLIANYTPPIMKRIGEKIGAVALPIISSKWTKRAMIPAAICTAAKICLDSQKAQAIYAGVGFLCFIGLMRSYRAYDKSESLKTLNQCLEKLRTFMTPASLRIQSQALNQKIAILEDHIRFIIGSINDLEDPGFTTMGIQVRLDDIEEEANRNIDHVFIRTAQTLLERQRVQVNSIQNRQSRRELNGMLNLRQHPINNWNSRNDTEEILRLQNEFNTRLATILNTPALRYPIGGAAPAA